MIVVDIAVWPGGSSVGAHRIGRIGVANLSPGRDPAEYAAVLLDDSDRVTDVRRVAAHRRDEGIYALLERVLSPGAADEVEPQIVMALVERLCMSAPLPTPDDPRSGEAIPPSDPSPTSDRAMRGPFDPGNHDEAGCAAASSPEARDADGSIEDDAQAALWEDLAGPFYDAAEVRTLLGCSDATLEKMIADLAVLALRTGEGQQVFPSAQFTDRGQVVPHLSAVLHALAGGTAESWTWLLWLTAPIDEWDGLTAFQWLAEGRDFALVVGEARADAAGWRS